MENMLVVAAALAVGWLSCWLIAVVVAALRANGRRILRAIGNGLVYLVGGLVFAGMAFWGVGILLVVLLVGTAAEFAFRWVPWSRLGQGLFLMAFGVWVFVAVRGIVVTPIAAALREKRRETANRQSEPS